MAGGTGIAYQTASTQIGVAVEVTKGTPVAPAFWIPVKSPKYKPNPTFIPDQTLQGSMVAVYNLVQGMRDDQHGWSAPPYLDTFPFLLRAELGSADNKIVAGSATTIVSNAAAGATTIATAATIAPGSYVVIGSGGTLETHKTGAVTGTTNPFSIALTYPLVYAQPSTTTVTPLTVHQFSLLNNAPGTGNQPPSVTLTDFDGEEWRQMSACQLDELVIKGNGTGLVDYTCSWIGNPAAAPSPTPTPAFTGIQSPAPWSFQAIIGGTQVVTIQDWEVSLKRGTKPVPGLTGTQAYFEYFAGPLQATAKLTFVEQSGSPYLTALEAGTIQSLDFTIFDLTTGNALNLHSTDAQYKTGELDRSKEWVNVVVDVELLPSTADALAGGVSPLIATVANGVTASF